MPADELFIGFDHVAYATRDTDATVEVLEALGFTVKIYKQTIEKFNAYITKMTSSAGHLAEIVEPISEPSAVSKLLTDREATVYHTCFKTNDFYQAHEKMKRAGALTVTRPMKLPYPATEAHENYMLSHMYHKHLGLFEVTGPAKEPEPEPADASASKPVAESVANTIAE